MLELNTSKGCPFLIDDEDYELVSQHPWHSYKHRNTYYIATNIKINDKWAKVGLHRIIMNAEPGQDVDHKNGNGLDNRRENLRLCTNTQNARNRKQVLGFSKYKGVHWAKNVKKWCSRIHNGEKRIVLGYFLHEEDAARAYDKAALKYFGEFAHTNFEGY